MTENLRTLAAADAHLPTVEQIAEAIEHAADWEHGFRDPEKVIAHIAETIRALLNGENE